VNFAYKGSTGQAALSGLDFSVKRGETLGVIGPTGSGKSTLAALLMRFYDVSGGEIFISGERINLIPENVLRGRVAIVLQTASLFTGTVKENILWGKEEATGEQIEKFAKAADAHGFISAMPEGYQTIIGQNGVNLSGGQKQRLSIARALIREPEILVLDDCTSALDAVTEAKVKRSIKKLSADMSCVLITQRIGAAMTCDKILVLENGNQAGFGTHEKLMETCEVYRDIYMSQIGKETEGRA
jgi:ATP-binding cassette subfamily B protein